MKPKYLDAFFLVWILLLIGCTSPKHILKPFKSDGCSLFPDRMEAAGLDWNQCCEAHDILYWKGGTKMERAKADSLFYECVLIQTGDARLARMMYDGVRLGGSPYFPTWYRWGYGWNYMRPYRELSQRESQMADSLLRRYYGVPSVPTNE